MRIKLIIFLVILVAFAAACSPGGDAESGSPIEDATSDHAPATEQSALNPVTPGTAATSLTDRPATSPSSEGYPPPAQTSASDYPPPPVEADLPTAYPEITIVILSTDIDPAHLTPESSIVGRLITPTPQQQEIIEAAARDLNVQTDVPVDEIELVSAAHVIWPNGGLGCPEEGMAYAEVQIEGMFITLRAGNQTHTYHTDATNQFVLCRDGARISSGTLR